MAKAVLISIRPEWVEKIANGWKTIEVRKTKPYLETPFKCYIYCTKAPKGWFWFDSPNIRRDGMVIGEFVCDDVKTILADSFVVREDALRAIEGTCLAIQQVKDYAGWKKGMQLCDCEPIYGWHISDLLIYDQPRELTEFRRPCPNDLWCEIFAMYSNNGGICNNGALSLCRPPQSWCYVEEEDIDG